MAYRQHQDLATRWVNIGQKPIERQIAASSPGDHQLALPNVDFAANLWVLHQNLQRVKNQSSCVNCGWWVSFQQEVAQALQIQKRLLGVNQLNHVPVSWLGSYPAAAPAA